MRKCKTCNSEFSAKDPRRQYCSDKCKWTFDNRRSLSTVAERKAKIKVENLEGEIWKDVEDYEGIYQISNFGRLKGLYNSYETQRGSEKINLCFPERIMKGSISKYGYVKYTLTKDNFQKVLFAHRIISIAFIPNPNNLDTVNHKDGNKLNNELSNLEWCTRGENTKHAFETGLNKPYKRTDDKGKQKHSIQIQCVRTGKVWPSIKAACKDLKTNPSSLKRVLNRISKSSEDFIYYNPAPSTWRNQ